MTHLQVLQGTYHTSGRHSGTDLVLGNLEVGLVAFVVGLEPQRLLEVVHGLLVLVVAAVNPSSPRALEYFSNSPQFSFSTLFPYPLLKGAPSSEAAK